MQVYFDSYAEPVIKAIDAIEDSVSITSMERFLENDVHDYINERTEARFKAQGDSRVGGKWKPLSGKSQADRARMGVPPRRPINIRRGELHDYVTQFVRAKGYAGGAVLILPGAGSRREMEKFKVAQAGLDPNPIPGWAPIPARPVLAINMVDARAIHRRLEVYVRMQIEGALGGQWKGRNPRRGKVA